jgi:hypothetical protein
MGHRIDEATRKNRDVADVRAVLHALPKTPMQADASPSIPRCSCGGRRPSRTRTCNATCRWSDGARGLRLGGKARTAAAARGVGVFSVGSGDVETRTWLDGQHDCVAGVAIGSCCSLADSGERSRPSPARMAAQVAGIRLAEWYGRREPRGSRCDRTEVAARARRANNNAGAWSKHEGVRLGRAAPALERWVVTAHLPDDDRMLPDDSINSASVSVPDAGGGLARCRWGQSKDAMEFSFSKRRIA